MVLILPSDCSKIFIESGSVLVEIWYCGSVSKTSWTNFFVLLTSISTPTNSFLYRCIIFIGRIILGDSSRVVQLHMKEGNAVIVSIAVAQGDKLEGISLNLSSHRIKEEMEDKGYQSSIFSDVLIFYENFVVLYWGDDGIDTIEWWDPEYWDQASFIEATYP